MNQALNDMRPYTYYTVMRHAQDPRILRLHMAIYAKAHGVKPAAREFKTTPKTVRKWLNRFDGKLASLQEHSRAPINRPRKLDVRAEKKILAAKHACPRFSARRIKDQFQLPYSVKAIGRVCRDHALNRPWRRKKPQTKRLLREVKKHWNFCQQIDIDTKNLCDIPEYWRPLKGLNLPQYQYTARDVTTGLLFLGYSNELSLSYATIFAQRIIKHLQQCGVDLSAATWQSDNGSEFIGSWQAKNDSAFTCAIQRINGQTHRTIPPGQHRFQADVETVHNLMEQEFYEIEPFAGRADFIDKADQYQLFFNLARTNRAKETKTPWELLNEKIHNPNPMIPLLSVPYLDELYDSILHSPADGGYDVWGLPYIPRFMNNAHKDAGRASRTVFDVVCAPPMFRRIRWPRGLSAVPCRSLQTLLVGKRVT